MARSPIKPGTSRLKRGRSTAKATKAQSARLVAIKAIGCLACRINENMRTVRGAAAFKACPMPVEAHHILSGGRRLGHDYTIALCRWHHQGDKWPELDKGANEIATIYAPSMARSAPEFTATYGQQLDLLHWQNQLLKESAK